MATKAVSTLPYYNPNLPEWKDGEDTTLGDLVMVIREVPPPMFSAASKAKPLSPLCKPPQPTVVSSAIPPGMKYKDAFALYASDRAYNRLGKVAMIQEVYKKQVVTVGKQKIEKAVLIESKQLIVTRGIRRVTIRESIRPRAWHDARKARVSN